MWPSRSIAGRNRGPANLRYWAGSQAIGSCASGGKFGEFSLGQCGRFGNGGALPRWRWGGVQTPHGGIDRYPQAVFREEAAGNHTAGREHAAERIVELCVRRGWGAPERVEFALKR